MSDHVGLLDMLEVAHLDDPKPSPEATERMARAIEPLFGTGAALVTVRG